MSDAPPVVTLSEWSSLGPEDEPLLAGRRLADLPAAELLARSRMLQATELRAGLRLEAASYVGRVRLGDLTVAILPKIRGASLLALLRYAYGFRKLRLLADATPPLDDCGLEDVLVCQLLAEAKELIARGLSKSYVPARERLASPRGRIDLQQFARDAGGVSATLPCEHYPRTEDSPLNQTLLGGLQLAGDAAGAIELRREARRLAGWIEPRVSRTPLTRDRLDRAERALNRLTRAYGPALAITRLLLDAQGVVLRDGSGGTSLSGFLFDMNAFFQALVSRFLRENLPGYEVRDEHRLQGMMRYQPRYNPQQRRAPTPRPDYLVIQAGQSVAILDAKYRDLWEHTLPREMLYQLVVYAVSDRRRPTSAILYPTMDRRAREARIEVADPLYGRPLGEVHLRPVVLPYLQEHISEDSRRARYMREAYARELAFGAEP